MAVALILIAFALVLLGTGGAVFALAFFRRSRRAPATTVQPPMTAKPTVSFRWKYISLPLIVLGLSVILTALFYGRLPAEVAWLFNLNGTPDRYLNLDTVIALLLVPQVVLALLAAGLTWSMVKLSLFLSQRTKSPVEASSVTMVMGNIMALPELVLFFAMLDIFVYNAYAMHLLPLWAFALVVMLAGGIVLGIFFIRAMMRMSAVHRKTTQE